MNEYKNMTTRELQKLYHEKALKANAKLEKLGDLRQYNNVMARKYEPILNDATRSYMHTKGRILKSGLVISPKFRTSIRASKQSIISAINTLDSFNVSPYTTAEYTQQQISRMRERHNISEDQVKDMFNLYREYGLDNYVHDSDEIITALSEIENSTNGRLDVILEQIQNDLDDMPMYTVDDVLDQLHYYSEDENLTEDVANAISEYNRHER